jgi:hypothetical protein
MAADAYEIPKANIPVPERGTYIPAFYAPHRDLSLPVLDANDGMLGFSIGQVLPERRWAIAEDGHLLPEGRFEQLYRQWIERVFVPATGAIVEVRRLNKYFDVGLETVPPVDEFVDAKPDPSMPTTNPNLIRFVPIGYEQGDADKGRRKIRPVYSHTGEKATDETAKEAAPLGFERMVPEPAAEPVETMPCGKEQRVKFKKQHMRVCKKCKDASAEQPAA